MKMKVIRVKKVTKDEKILAELGDKLLKKIILYREGISEMTTTRTGFKRNLKMLAYKELEEMEREYEKIN